MQKLTEREANYIRQLEERAFKKALSEKANRWRDLFDERQRRLIANCQIYAQNDPAGMPGHQLALIISRFADILDADGAKSRRLKDYE